MSEQPGYTYDVFISYSHADSEWVRGELLPRLEEAGLEVIIDYRDFEVGVPSLVNMERAVDTSRHTLAVLTPHWVGSEWAQFESLLIGTADPAGRQRRLLPLMLQRCRLPARISMLTCADFTDPGRRGEEMARLLRAMGVGAASAGDYESLAHSALLDTDEQNSYLAGQGLAALIELMQAPEIHTAVVAFQTDFQAASEQIGVLNGYKRLHDLFQELENHYYLIESARKRLPADDTAWDDLTHSEPELRGKLDDLVEAANQTSLASDETWWLQQLSSARDELREAVEEFDVEPLKTASRRLHRVLDRQPSRINARLVATADVLRLDALVKAMITVSDSLASHRLELDAVRQFEEGVSALDRLENRLTQLINAHNGWQAIDDELRRVEANLAEDIVELKLAWPDLKQPMHALYGDSAADWAVSLKTVGTQLETALSTEDPVKAKRLFRRYRSQMGHRFRRVNSELLALCKDLQKVGEALDLLLRTIQ